MPFFWKTHKAFTWFGERIFIQKRWHLIDKVSQSLNMFLNIFLICCSCIFKCNSFQFNLLWHTFVLFCFKKKKNTHTNSRRAELLLLVLYGSVSLDNSLFPSPFLLFSHSLLHPSPSLQGRPQWPLMNRHRADPPGLWAPSNGLTF